MNETDPTPLNIRQRRFADLVLTGIPAGRAYEQAGYKASGDVADTSAARLLRNVRVSEFLQAARMEIEEDHSITRNQFIGYLTAVMMTPIGLVDSTSPLVQEYSEVRGERIAALKVKMVPKIEAAKLLCAIMGWAKPIQEPSNRGLAELIHAIRRGHGKAVESATAQQQFSE